MDAWISANKRAVLPDVRSSSSLQTEMLLPAPSRGIGGRESGCQDCNGVSGSVVRSAKWGLPGDDEMGTAAATEADEEPIKEKSPPPFLATLKSSCCPRCCCCSCRRCHSGSTRASAAFAARSISLDLRSRFSTQYRVIRSSETHDATSSSILPSCPSHPGGGAVLRAADGLPVDSLFGGDGGDDVFLSLLSSMSTALLSVETKEAADVSHSIMTASESDAGAIRKVSPSRIAVTAANLAAVAADEAAEAEADDLLSPSWLRMTDRVCCTRSRALRPKSSRWLLIQVDTSSSRCASLASAASISSMTGASTPWIGMPSSALLPPPLAASASTFIEDGAPAVSSTRPPSFPVTSPPSPRRSNGSPSQLAGGASVRRRSPRSTRDIFSLFHSMLFTIQEHSFWNSRE